MDAIGRVKRINNKGFALVYIALMIVVLVTFVSLAVDVGYMYVAKGQLQNAADAGALAGAAKLDKTNSPTQTDSRLAAVTFANKNIVVPSVTKVIISNDGTNVLAPGNDITVGNWNASKDPKYLEGRTPINAAQVRARRTSDSPGGPVNLFLSKVIGVSSMGTLAVATAARLPRAGAYFMIGQGTCTSSMSLTLKIDSGSTGNMAWTTILDNSTNASDVSSLICGKTIPDIDVCGHSLYTTQGTSTSVFKDIESAFYNTDYDQSNKYCTTSTDPVPKDCTTVTGNKSVVTWTVTVPVSVQNNPALQPNPAPVYGYATITMTRACGSGGGSPCLGANSPIGVCTGGETDIVISSIVCVSCDDPSSLLGAKPNLVQ